MKQIIRKIIDKWIDIIQWINKIVITILLATLFLLFITPLALIKRTFTGRRHKGYIVREYSYRIEDLKKMW